MRFFSLLIVTMIFIGCGGGGGSSSDKNKVYNIPISGEENKDWFIANYIDKDQSEGSIADYRGGKMTYDGHEGVDFTLKDFDAMDSGVDVICSRSGIVTDFGEDEFDRQETAVDTMWNYVEVTHDDGTKAYYGHLKQNSVTEAGLSIGLNVNVGDKLGEVGSSGFSTNPHLHFELRSADGTLIDPFTDNEHQQVFDITYVENIFIMQQGVTQNAAELDSNYWHHTPIDSNCIDNSTPLYYWNKLVHQAPGDKITATILNTNINPCIWEYDFFATYSYWYCENGSNFNLGNYILQVTLESNGQDVQTFDLPFTVSENCN